MTSSELSLIGGIVLVAFLSREPGAGSREQKLLLELELEFRQPSLGQFRLFSTWPCRTRYCTVHFTVVSRE
jgi:hypothetical protein